jgi:hypothetical protein
MVNKKSFWGMLAMALIFGVVFLGCPNNTTEETDTWSDVTTLSQLNGTWKGSYSQTMTYKEMVGENWTSDMQTMVGDMKVTIGLEITLTINASDKTQASSMTMTQAYSGGNIDTIWSTISSGYSGQPGVTVDNAKHSITITSSQPAQSLSDEDIAEMLEQGLQINQNGTKVKLPAVTIMGTGSPEIVIIKQ